MTGLIGIALLIWGSIALITGDIHTISMAGPPMLHGLEARGWGLLFCSLGVRSCLEMWAEPLMQRPRWEAALYWAWRIGATIGFGAGAWGFWQRVSIVT